MIRDKVRTVLLQVMSLNNEHNDGIKFLVPVDDA